MNINSISLSSFLAVILFSAGIGIALIGCTEDGEEVLMKQELEEIREMPCTSGVLYLEKDGFVRIEAESILDANDWVKADSLGGFSGDGYLVWTKEDNFNTPGKGLLKYSVKITNPGTYQFVWSSRITQGTSNTDFNDSWLRIPTANDFYAEKDGGAIVYPKGSGKTPLPEGSGSNGWFKVYMNRVGEWFWRSSTSDRDPHNIYARFDSPGIYDIEISGRSKFHAIDQFVLFKTDKNLTVAKSAALSEITCK